MGKGLVKTLVAALALAWACGCAPGRAATLVDTGAVRNPFIGESVIDRLYGQITLAAASRINAIEGYITSNGEALRVDLLSDLNGRPGSVLHSLANTVFSTKFAAGGSSWPYKTFKGWQGATNLDWQVAAGTYWVAFVNESIDPNRMMSPSMQRNAAVRPLAHYDRYWSRDGRTTDDDDGDYAFRVLGTVSAVPEPATWAMMIVGFCVIGATMGYRRRHATGSHQYS